MFWYHKTLVEFDIVQHQISFAGTSDVRLSFASPSITCPGKANLMLDLVASNKCLMCFNLKDPVNFLKLHSNHKVNPFHVTITKRGLLCVFFFNTIFFQ